MNIPEVQTNLPPHVSFLETPQYIVEQRKMLLDCITRFAESKQMTHYMMLQMLLTADRLLFVEISQHMGKYGVKQTVTSMEAFEEAVLRVFDKTVIQNQPTDYSMSEKPSKKTETPSQANKANDKKEPVNEKPFYQPLKPNNKKPNNKRRNKRSKGGSKRGHAK